MAGSNLELARQGGRFNADMGQLLTAEDVDRIGAFSVSSLLHFLMLMFWDEEQQRPISGFPREQLSTDHCRVTATGDLDFEVSTGFGLLFNSSALGADEFEPSAYRPIVVDTILTDALDAHDPTNPRIDIVCLAPAWVSDQAATRNVKDPSSGVISSSSIPARRRFGATLQVVTGTPAGNPTEPATPAGYVKIAKATVPATSGAATWRDERPVLEVGALMKGMPSRYHTLDFVPLGGSSELEVTAKSPAAMYVDVERGRAVIAGQMRTYGAQTLAVTAAHATLDRIDLVVAKSDGTLAIVDGTPDASPTAPSAPAGGIGLAELLVEATVTSIDSGDITDRRKREPYNGTLVRKNSVNEDRLLTPFPMLTLSAPGYLGDQAIMAVATTYPDGSTSLDGDAFQVEIEVFEASFGAWGTRLLVADAAEVELGVLGTGISLVSSGPKSMGTLDPLDPSSLILERSSGAVVGTWYVFIRPLNRPGAGSYRTVTFT